MKLSGLRGRKVNLRSARIVLTTDDLAELLNTTNQAIRHRISSGDLKLTGDSVRDFRYLMSLVE